ncbi:MAG TPA: adenosylcobinamide amidohydrolase [Candidatus Nitrosotalea sp.]|jgi:iron complex transport system ATP-binding protein|nr:adenosylcobinamide amidohydrolase [Candidatus Nitrosotalea sp.]
MIAGVSVEIGAEAVVVASPWSLRVVSSAVHLGGFVDARAILNVHVAKNDPCLDPSETIAAFARHSAVPEPWVGLLTGAATERAVVSEEAADGCAALAVVTVGLSNPVAAGLSRIARCGVSTINTIVVVDADPEPAALVNAVITATEVKALALRDAGILAQDGVAATGTSTDAVVIAATGRGGRARFGGPASPLGWVVARAVRAALVPGIHDWLERNR